MKTTCTHSALELKDTLFYKKTTFQAKGKILSLDKPIVMGILNVTPDSFYDGGTYLSEKSILLRAETILKEGASIIDIGGYSSRPGSSDVSEEEEMKRVVPAIAAISKEFPESIISIDTFRSKIAEAAINAGAALINDISGGSIDPEIFQIAGKHKVPYILMHMRGTPQTMTSMTDYDDIMLEIIRYFEKKAKALYEAGVKDIIIDPGFGFAKTIDQNYEILNRFDEFKILGMPVLAGMSRKIMTYKPLGAGPEDALFGTICVNTIALLKGADILRVHDVKEAVQTIKIFLKTTRGN